MTTCPACGQAMTRASYDLAKFEFARVSAIPAGVRTDWEQMFVHALALLISEYELDPKFVADPAPADPQSADPQGQAPDDMPPIGRRNRVRRPGRQES